MNLPVSPSIQTSCPTIDAAIDTALTSKRLVGTVVMVARVARSSIAAPPGLRTVKRA